MKHHDKAARYEDVMQRIHALIANEDDAITIMATVACELHQQFDYYDWTGFYRVVAPGLLKVGPYQGTHGCLKIPFERGVCGAAARSLQTQLVSDVNQIPDHIACSSSTQSEIVVPLLNTQQQLIAVLDVDSNQLGAFDHTDQHYLEMLCRQLSKQL